jgi:septal ring factor EnvC (AmiA/AmiB activator)
LEKTIDDLKHELKVRPTFDELVGLQTSLDELDTLHKNEIKSHEDEINRVRTDNKDLHKQLQDALAEQARLLDESVAREKFTNTKITESFSSGTSTSPQDINSLPVYIPQTQFDPSSGKDDWCGLCERDGHTSINCPYENDIF